jgi:hypothetical protein
MTKLFELSIFLNFVVVGIVLGYGGYYINYRRLVLLMLAYMSAYTVIGIIVLSDVGFLVPEP